MSWFSIRCLLLLFGTMLGAAAAEQKLNVLLIISDDLRDTLGCYGNKVIQTPNVDRLAKRGVIFEHAYAQYPVCNPSRTSFLTGMRCEQTQVVDNRTLFRTKLPDVVTLPQLFRQHGYYAASFGKVYHVGEVMGEVREGWMDVGKSWDEGTMFQPTPAGREIEGRNMTGGKLPWCRWGAAAGTDNDQPDGQTAQHAVNTIERNTKAGKPWFVAAGFHRPHDPFVSPKKYFDMYPLEAMRIYHDPTNISPLLPLSIAGGGFQRAFDAFTENDRKEFQRAYYAGVSFMDAQVGRLMKAMDKLKLWESTIVIFMGDNGYHHNERNWWNKNTLFERSCRVPMIAVTPGGAKGKACHGLVELLDLYPTLADYCGLEAAQTLGGTSLRRVLQEPGRQVHDAAFTLVVRGKGYGQAVRTASWRYIQWSDGRSELYDEQNDREETRNLAGDPDKATVVAEHRKLLERVGSFKQN